MDLVLDQLARCTGFERDDGNIEKNRIKHGVSRMECERVFFNRPLTVGTDAKHSRTEPRYYALGETDSGRRLFIVFTVRDDLIRVISARNMSRREKRTYRHEKEKENS